MKCLAYTLIVVGILNFASFVIIALILGGDAVNGKTEGGKFYLANHGDYTEVSRSVFDYSRCHVYSVWITHPLAMISAFLLNREDRKRKAQ